MPQDSLGIHLLLLLFFFGPIKPCNLLLHSRLCHLCHVLLGIKAAELAICPSGALCWNVVQWWLPRKYLGKKYLKALLNMTRLVAIIEPVYYKLISPFLLWKFWNVGSYARRPSKIAQLNVPSTHVACRFVMFFWNSHGYHARQRKLRWFQQFSTFFRNWAFYSSVCRFGALQKFRRQCHWMNYAWSFLTRIDILQLIAGKEGSGDPVLRKALGSGWFIKIIKWFIQALDQFSPFWTLFCPSTLLVPAASWFPSHRGSLQDLVWDAWHGQTWKPCHENLCMILHCPDIKIGSG